MSSYKYVPKKWGHEIWIENNELYCGKELYVKKDCWSSDGKFHYHKKKDETFYVLDGVLRLEIIDENREIISYAITSGSKHRILPGTKHRFKAISDGCKFIEFSTTHSDEDSYRGELRDGKWYVEYDKYGGIVVEEEEENPFEGIYDNDVIEPPPIENL
jgi:mannose-6-phosphate isomerase-like protein (cupin superfamily)